MQIGSDGRLQEWLEDFRDARPGHRHMSHLFGLHPGAQITPRGTPELAAAARKTLDARLAHGGGHTGWSRAWIINFFARLEDGAQAHEHLAALLAKSTFRTFSTIIRPSRSTATSAARPGSPRCCFSSRRRAASAAGVAARVAERFRHRPAGRGGLELDIAWRDGPLAAGHASP